MKGVTCYRKQNPCESKLKGNSEALKFPVHFINATSIANFLLRADTECYVVFSYFLIIRAIDVLSVLELSAL